MSITLGSSGWRRPKASGCWRQLGAARDAADGALHALLGALVAGHLAPQQLQVAADHLQQVGEVVRHAAAELAQRFHALRLAQRRLRQLALGRLVLQLGQRIAEFGRAQRHALLQGLFECCQRRLGAVLVGDVVAIDEDALHRAVGVEDGLIDDADEAFLERRSRRALDLHHEFVADERRGRVVHLVQ
jgi:hypothetical protein